MQESDLEDILKRVNETGSFIQTDESCRVYGLLLHGKPVHLKFFPAGKALHVGNAMSEFTRLQWLQKAGVNAPRPVATLMGFSLGNEKGDALIVEALEPAINLLDFLKNQEQTTQSRALIPQNLFYPLLGILTSLAKAKLGCHDLNLSKFIIHKNLVYLKNAEGIHKEGLSLDELLQFAAYADPYLSRTLYQRAWNRLGNKGPMPKSNPRILSLWHDQARMSLGDNSRFTQFQQAGRRIHAFLQTPTPRHWSETSWLSFTPDHWKTAWAELSQKLDAGALQVLKESDSGDVLEGQLRIGDHLLDIIVKRPKPKNFRRLISQWILGPRARRAWVKAWELVERDIPTAWPLALVEGKGQSLLIMEKVPGKMLADVSPDETEALSNALFHAGRTLRRMESTGLYLYDAKAYNWIVRPGKESIPVVIDIDSVRRIRQPGGFNRLLRSLRELHGDKLTRALERQLALGYEPAASRHRQNELLGKR